MNVSVLGAGNGGCAVAADWALAGHKVRLFDFEAFGDNIAAINRQKGLVCKGRVEGFARLDYAGHSMSEALRDAELVLLVGPAFSTRPLAEAMRPHVRGGQTIIACPGSCGGALEIRQRLRGLPDFDDLVIAETATLPYACRMDAPGKVRIYHKLTGGILLGTLPAASTRATLELFRQVYPGTTAAANIFQAMLQNANPVIHPAVTLLNAGLIERGCDFLFYEQGATPAAGNLIEALDRERIAIGRALGVEILPDPVIGVQQGYMQQANYQTGYSSAEGFRGIRAQSQLDHRYLNEDVGYGLVFMSRLGQLLDVPTPTMDAVITLASCIMGRDFRREAARTPEGLGLSGNSRETLLTAAV